MNIAELVQRPNLGAEIFLYKIDLSAFGLGFLYLTPGTNGATVISFDGDVYAPHAITAEGFEMTTSGPLPRPRISIANLDGALTAMVEANDDLTGAIITRIRTFERYLDDGADPDPTAIKMPDIYTLSRKTAHDDEQISWEMAALIDQEGQSLPGRRISRDYCDHDYRRWTGAAFDYSQATCPYVGAQSYDLSGNPVASALDAPSKQLSTCCKKRFGNNGVLPTRAFPGVARLSVR